MKVFVATHNKHKLREIAEIFSGFEIVADDPQGVEETEDNFTGNALIKVRAIASRHAGEWCMADDSGLEVEALGGAPGVRSARYSGDEATAEKNNSLLLANLSGAENRRANFACAIALVDPQGREHTAVGKVFGRISETLSGAEGFGYDPLFIPDGYEKSFAELSSNEKNAISHRGRALAEAYRIMCPPEKGVFKPFLKLFRAVNIPTVPGDVLVGAAAAVLALGEGAYVSQKVAFASVSSILLYMFGLADNDIVGAKTDRSRPIPAGEISLLSVRWARSLCWFAALVCAAVGNLPPAWWVAALALYCSIILYNRTKRPVLMGLCRALNVLCGVGALASPKFLGGSKLFVYSGAVCAVWFAYVTFLTWYASDESVNPSKKPLVSFLIGAIVYLQLVTLLIGALAFPPTAALQHLLLTGAVLLIVLRLFKRFMPNISAT